MIDIFLYKGICPFCDNKAEVIHIEQVDKINILVDFECACDWKHSKLIDRRKNFYIK
ncbi:Uncharacterised protein [uncultured Clostridium sp.]|nr:Uncharacterised protein [uncultured Clostridium sp.]